MPKVSRQAANAKKPKKPCGDLPPMPHPGGQWCKKVRGGAALLRPVVASPEIQGSHLRRWRSVRSVGYGFLPTRRKLANQSHSSNHGYWTGFQEFDNCHDFGGQDLV
jgi:hypothetical protein